MAKTTVLTKANLTKIAEELNKFGFEPPIDLKSEETMREGILDVAPDLTDKDEISSLCKRVIDSLQSSQKKSTTKGTDTDKKAPAKKSTTKETDTDKKPAKKSTTKGTDTDKKSAAKKKGATTLSVFGHKPSSQGAAIDEIVKDGKGHKLDKLAEKVGVTTSRVLGHLKHLDKDVKDVKSVTEKNGVYTVVSK